jgi:hypothetical protein
MSADSAPFSTHYGPLDNFLDQWDDFVDFSHNPERIEEEWRRLRSLRINVLRLRDQLRKKRDELRKSELNKSSSDDAFMKYIRQRHHTAVMELLPDKIFVDPTLESHFKTMQAVRDDYGSLEDDYKILEERLDDEEFELAKVEGRFYRNKIQSVAAASDSNLRGTEFYTPPPTESFLGFSTDSLQAAHPLYANYLSRLGDLDLAKERHQNMILEQEDLLRLRESKLVVGMDLDNDEKIFLENLPLRKAELQQEMEKIKKDVEQLKKKCLEAGIDISESVNDSDDDGDENDDNKMEDNVLKGIHTSKQQS